MTQDDHLSIEATLGIWSELEAARCGKNGYGGTVAEIYAYRLLPGLSPLAYRGVAGEQHEDRLACANTAGANLTTILRQFRSAYPSCQIGIEEGVRKFRALDLASEAVPSFDHRIHIEVLDSAAKEADTDYNIRRVLSEADETHDGSSAQRAILARVSVEVMLRLVEAVDRLTDAVDEHGGKIATAIDYISDHLPGDR
jgi:hypothetical protein